MRPSVCLYACQYIYIQLYPTLWPLGLNPIWSNGRIEWMAAKRKDWHFFLCVHNLLGSSRRLTELLGGAWRINIKQEHAWKNQKQIVTHRSIGLKTQVAASCNRRQDQQQPHPPFETLFFFFFFFFLLLLLLHWFVSPLPKKVWIICIDFLLWSNRRKRGGGGGVRA